MKTWNDPTVIPVILPQAVSRKTPIEVQFFYTSVEIHVSGKKVNWKNMENGFGYEISASRLLYHIRLVAQVCLLPFSAHRIEDRTQINQESSKNIENP